MRGCLDNDPRRRIAHVSTARFVIEESVKLGPSNGRMSARLSTTVSRASAGFMAGRGARDDAGLRRSGDRVGEGEAPGRIHGTVRRHDGICAERTAPIVAVLADGDLATVVRLMKCQHDGGQPYTGTWFDMWRIVNGRADERRDPAMRIQTGCQPGR